MATIVQPNNHLRQRSVKKGCDRRSVKAADGEYRETVEDLRESLSGLKGKQKKEDDIHHKVGDGSMTLEEPWKESMEEVIDEEPPANAGLKGELKSQALINPEQNNGNEMLQAQLIADKEEIKTLQNKLAGLGKKTQVCRSG